MAKIKEWDDIVDDWMKVADYLDNNSIAYGYPTNKASKNDPKSTVAQVAAYAEYGKKGSSGGWERVPRKFMTMAELIAEGDSERRSENLSIPILRGTVSSVKTAMRKEAAILGDTVREAILDNVYAPLKPSTISKKGHAEILIETGDLYDSAAGVVINNSEIEEL